MSLILIRFRHGLGDCVQLGVVLQHLLKVHPGWIIDVAVVDPGKGRIFEGFERVRAVSWEANDRPYYDFRYELAWSEPESVDSDRLPATKAENCLRRFFAIEPEVELCRYVIPTAFHQDPDVDGYLSSLAGARLQNGKFPVVVIHYEGNTSCDKKNLPHGVVARLCETVISQGYVPVILDWDNRSILPNGSSIHCPNAHHPLWQNLGTGNGVVIAHLIEAASLFVGIDSGPQKIAAATTTPMICVWRGHHPIHYFPTERRTASVNCQEPSGLVRHVVPVTHAESIRGDREKGLRLFSLYDHVKYDEQQLAEVLQTEVVQQLPAKPRMPSQAIDHLTATVFFPHATSPDQNAIDQRNTDQILPDAQWLREQIPLRSWTYHRVGLDQRRMALTGERVASNFWIREGAADRERVWNIEQTPCGPILTVWGDHGGATFHASWQQEKFVGRWLCCEECEVELIPDRPFNLPRKSHFNAHVDQRREPPPFFVGVVTRNCYDICTRLIDSIFAGTLLPQAIFVIDNGNGIERFSHSDSRVSILRAQRNLGVARSWNLLHRLAAPDSIVILNDDIELGKNCLERLLTHSGSAVTLDASHLYEAFLLRPEVWQIVGEFDEQFFPAYFEDNDHARRVELAGFQFECPLSDGVISHGRSSTMNRLSQDDRDELDRAIAKNREYYVKKWGGMPHQEVYRIPFDGHADWERK